MSCLSSRQRKSTKFLRRFSPAASITISAGLREAEIVERLRHVANQDGITIEDRSLTAFARASEGSMRDGLSLLDQAVAFGGKTIVHTDLEALLGAVPQELLRAMIQAITGAGQCGGVACAGTVVGSRDTICGPTVPMSWSICAICSWSLYLTTRMAGVDRGLFRRSLAISGRQGFANAGADPRNFCPVYPG